MKITNCITYTTFLFVVFLFTLASCSKGSDKTAYIEGEIKGMGNDTLYIYGTDHSYDRIDTIPVNADKFKATIPADTLTASWLQLNNGIRYPLYFDKGDKIHIKGDLNTPDFFDIKGNPANDELTSFIKELEGTTNGQAAPTPEQQQAKAEAFIRSHNTSLASVYLLRKYLVLIPNPDLNKIQELINGMSGTLKDNQNIIELSDFLSDNEKTTVGKNVPYFRLKDTKKKNLARTDFKDQWILMHFWASWDTPSRQQLSILRRIYKEEKKNKHFALLGISLDTDHKLWEEAIEQDTLQWKQGSELAGWNSDIVQKFSIYKLPANLLLNPKGKIMAKDLDEADIRKWLKTIEEEAEKEKKKKK